MLNTLFYTIISFLNTHNIEDTIKTAPLTVLFNCSYGGTKRSSVRTKYNIKQYDVKQVSI